MLRLETRTLSFPLLIQSWLDDFPSTVASETLLLERLGVTVVEAFDNTSLCSMARLWGRERDGVVGVSDDGLSAILGETDDTCAGNFWIFFTFPEEVDFLITVELSLDAVTPLP
jgi:hypothetical protein